MELRGLVATKAGRTAAIVILCNLVAALLLGWFAGNDLFGSGTFGVRVRAFILAGAAAILFASAAATATLWYSTSATVISKSAATSLFGSSLGALTGLLLLFYQLLEGDITGAIFVWLLTIALTSWSTYSLWRAGARLQYPKSVAVATTLATVIAITNFMYTSIYAPAANPVKVTVTSTISALTLSPDRSYATVPVVTSITNIGMSKLRVLGTIYSVVGRKASVSTPQTPNGEALAVQNYQPARSVFTSSVSYELIQADSFLSFETEFEAGDKADLVRIVKIVDPGRYEALLIAATIVYVAGDKSDADASAWPVPQTSWDPYTGAQVVDSKGSTVVPGTSYLTTDFPYLEASYLREKVRADRVFRVRLVLARPELINPSGPYLTGDIVDHDTPIDSPDSEDAELAAERYGLMRSTSGISEISMLDTFPGSVKISVGDAPRSTSK